MRLTDEELREVLARAEEIQQATRRGGEWESERSAVISAGEAVGLSRTAIERAIGERFGAPTLSPTVGDLTWARSADGKFYVAEVLASREDGARVRFLRGSEHEVALDGIRPCSFLPGERVVCNWPWWGTWTCSVVSYEAALKRVTLSDGWGETESFSIADVWLPAMKKPRDPSRARVYATVLAAGASAGAIVGAIITAILMR